MFPDSNKDSSSSGFRISIFTQNLVFRRKIFTGSGILVKPRFSADLHPIFAIFFLNTLWWIFLLMFENQLICLPKMAAMGQFAYSRSTWMLPGRQYSSDLHKLFFWIPSDGLSCSSSKISRFAYRRWPPWADLHIRDQHERSPVVNIYLIFAIFLLNTLWLIILLKFENQLICIYPRWPQWANLHIQDRHERSAVLNIHPIFAIFFLNSLWLLILLIFENQLLCISKMAVMA